MLAPKLSALQKDFPRRDLTVIALYMETCDGVPDHAAEFRRQVAKHEIDYPALDAEAGSLRDPTRERMPWAPHAVLVDGRGRVLRTYPHLPRLGSLREDLRAVIATGLLPRHPDDGWREFPRKAWIDVRIEGRGAPRDERHVLVRTWLTGVTVRRGKETVTLPHAERAATDGTVRREEMKPETITVGGKTMPARVFREVRERGGAVRVQRRWIARGALVRLESRETGPDGKVVTRSERLTDWAKTVEVGGHAVSCRVYERRTTWDGGHAAETAWISDRVPGHVVKRVVRTDTGGRESSESFTVTGFGLR